MDFLRPDAAGLSRAARLVRGGELIGFPTDTVYGLAARACDGRAVRRIYEVKARPLSRPLILMVADPAQLEPWAYLDERARRFMARWWPGALTLVLPAREHLAPPLTSADWPRTVAARVPAHPVALALLREVAEPLATTSANRSGDPPALTPLEAAWVNGLAAVIDAGRAPGEVPSTLLDVTAEEPRVLREGPIREEELLAAW